MHSPPSSSHTLPSETSRGVPYSAVTLTGLGSHDPDVAHRSDVCVCVCAACESVEPRSRVRIILDNKHEFFRIAAVLCCPDEITAAGTPQLPPPRAVTATTSQSLPHLLSALFQVEREIIVDEMNAISRHDSSTPTSRPRPTQHSLYPKWTAPTHAPVHPAMPRTSDLTHAHGSRWVGGWGGGGVVCRRGASGVQFVHRGRGVRLRVGIVQNSTPGYHSPPVSPLRR